MNNIRIRILQEHVFLSRTCTVIVKHVLLSTCYSARVTQHVSVSVNTALLEVVDSGMINYVLLTGSQLCYR